MYQVWNADTYIYELQESGSLLWTTTNVGQICKWCHFESCFDLCWQSENHFLCPLLLLVTIYRVISTTFKSKHPKNTNQAPQNHNHCHLRSSSQLLSGHQEIRTGSSNSTANPFTSSYFLLEYEWTSENQCCLRIHSTTADCDARIPNWKIHLHDHRSIFVFSEGKIYGVWCMEA